MYYFIIIFWTQSKLTPCQEKSSEHFKSCFCKNKGPLRLIINKLLLNPDAAVQIDFNVPFVPYKDLVEVRVHVCLKLKMSFLQFFYL